MPVQFEIGMGIHVDDRRLSGLHPRELGFLVVRFDPDLI
jgi:hypothetical protein